MSSRKEKFLVVNRWLASDRLAEVERNESQAAKTKTTTVELYVTYLRRLC